MAGISEFLKELRRRRVFRVAAFYIVASWLLLQVADLAFESWGLTASALRYVWIAALIGFPPALVFGWIYDIRDGGIIRTPKAQAGDTEDLSLHRSDCLLLGAMAMICVAVVYGTFHQIQLTDALINKARIGVRVSSWPEADLMFRQDPDWLGGNVTTSIDLGGGRILWFFGDSWVASETGQSRAESTWVRNTVAIQRGYDPSSAALQFYWRVDGLRPASLFPDKVDSWYWPRSAILLDRSLLIFLEEAKASVHDLGSEQLGVTALLIDNPQEAPDLWQPRDLLIPPNELGIFVGWSGAIRVNNYVYAFSPQQSTGDVYLVRWPVEEISVGILQGSEWWSGDTEKWVPAAEAGGKERPVFSDTRGSFSIHYIEKLKEFVQVETWGFPDGVFAMRTASEVTGPWSDRRVIFQTDERRRPGINIFGGHGHSHLIGADIVATYCTSSLLIGNTLGDESIVYPRFVRIFIEP